MKLGNRAALDTERETLRDSFDAIWVASTEIGETEARAIRCAIALDKPSHDNSYNWRILEGGPHVRRIQPRHLRLSDSNRGATT